MSYQVTPAELRELLAHERARRIDAVHLHRTNDAERDGWHGLASLRSIRAVHMAHGLIDIAQHLTVDPYGVLWTGRDWNVPPASVAGKNGSHEAGPFMIAIAYETADGDRLTSDQRSALVGAIAMVLKSAHLGVDALVTHQELQRAARCPGAAVDLTALRSDVAAEMERAEPADASLPPSPFSDEFGVVAELLKRAAHATRQQPHRDEQPPDHCRTASGRRRRADVVPAPVSTYADTAVPRRLDLTPDQLQKLRRHAVALRAGAFGTHGTFTSSAADVDAMFFEHVGPAMDRNPDLALVFYAHGGLVGADEAVGQALEQIDWWTANGVYPIFFIWETGFFEIVEQLLTGALSRALPPDARGIVQDAEDHVIELLARPAGEKVWSAMKTSAALASADGGGARYVAQTFNRFCRQVNRSPRIHAVGHSAGAIFHGEFLPVLIAEAHTRVDSLHFLAPAVRVDQFFETLAPLLGDTIRSLTMFTMQQDWERADTAGPYHKSLLYLIANAFEADRRAAIFGLEESIRGDARARALFGLAGNPPTGHEIVWSRSAAATGRSASRAVHHGNFPCDPATMESVARRVLDVKDGTALEEDYPHPCPPDRAFVAGMSPVTAFAAPSAPALLHLAPLAGAGAQPGRRRALCVGIDSYERSPLTGCVRDARLWARTLTQSGFTVDLLLENAATYQGIRSALQQLIATSTPGDVTVFQYAGHGTRFDDPNRYPKPLEAICPFDFFRGAFLLDREFKGMFAAIPAGANVTAFFDCCHSGDINRLLFARERTRFLPMTPDLYEQHDAFRARAGFALAADAPRGEPQDVTFAACSNTESAFESNGQGEYTLRATTLLASGIPALSNQEFNARVVAAFGATPRQHPELDCELPLRTRPFLRPVAAAAAPSIPAAGEAPASLAELLEQAAAYVRSHA